MQRWVLGLSIAVLLLGVGLRLHRVDAQSLWHDEGNSLRLAERSVNDLIDAVSRDIHPPGYYLVLKGWTSLVGTTEFGLRSLSVFWGILTIAATIGLARQFVSPAVIPIAGLLVAIQPFAIYYAQETRMYAQLGALSVLSLWLLLRFVHAKQHQWQWAIGLAVVNTLGLYTHYTYPFTMLAQGCYVVWVVSIQRNTKLLPPFIGLNMLTLVCFAPWLPTAYDQVTTWPTTGDTTTTIDRLDRVFMITVYGNTADELTLLAYTLPLGLIAAALMSLRRQTALLLPLFLVIFSIGSLLLSGAYREANLKFLLPTQAIVALLLTIGLAEISRWRQPVTSVVGVVLLAVFMLPFNSYLNDLYSATEYQRSNYRSISQTIDKLETDNSVVILNAPNQEEVFSYYFTGESPVVGLPRGLGGDDDATRAETELLVTQNNRIFLVLWGQTERDPNATVQSTLDANAFVVDRQWYTDVELVQYAVLDTPPDTPQSLVDVQFGDVMTLTGFSLSEDEFLVGRGEALGVTLYWQAETEITERYKISVQVLTPQGFLADQHDSEPANNLRPTTSFMPNEVVVDNHGLILNTNLPAGEYSLNVVVYNANPPSERLQPSTGEPNAILPLTTLTLVAAN